MNFREYSKVRLTNDKFLDQGVGKGCEGYIIEIYREGSLEYEVEFSKQSTGETIASVVLKEEDIESAE